MRLRLNTTLRAALIAAITAVGFTLSQATASTVLDGQTYSGDVYTWSKGGTDQADMAYGGWKKTTQGNPGYIYEDEIITWDPTIKRLIANGGSTTFTNDLNTIRFATDTGSNTNMKYTFFPLSVAGIIAEDAGYTITASSGNRPVYIGNATATAARSDIKANFTINTSGAGDNGTMTFMGTQTWNVASGATFTLNSGKHAKTVSGALSITGGGIVAFDGTGTVAMTGDSSLEIQANTTLQVSSGLTMAASGATVTNNGNLQLGGTIKFGAAGIENNGTVSLTTTGLVFDLSQLTDQDNTYTLFTGSSAVDLSTLGLSSANITGIVTAGKTFTFHDNGTITFEAATKKTWTAQSAANWNYEDENWEGGKFVSGEGALFNLDESMATVNVAVEASGIEVASGSTVTLNVSGAGSLSSASVVIADGATMISNLSINNVEEFSVGSGATWNIFANQSLGKGTNNGTIYLGAEGTARLTDASNSKDLLLGITGSGNIELAVNTNIEGGTNEATKVSSKATGKLIIDQGVTLGFGRPAISGGFSQRFVDLSSFSAVDLNGGTLQVHMNNLVLNNLTVNTANSSLKVLDTAGVGSPALTLQGTTTLNKDLTLTSNWKHQIVIKKLAGTGALNLNGNDNSVVNIGTSGGDSGTVGKISVQSDATKATLNGTLTITGNLEAKKGTTNIAGTVDVKGEIDLSAGGNATGTILVKNGGSLTAPGMWGRSAAHLNIEKGGTVNLAKLSIVGADSEHLASIATTGTNTRYGVTDNTWTISNASITAKDNVTIGNKLDNSSVITGAYAVTVNNANNVIAGATVGEGGSFSMTGGALLSVIESAGSVTLSGIFLADEIFTEQGGGEGAHYDLEGKATEGANYYLGTADKYVTVVDGGTSATGANITWGDTEGLSMTDGKIVTEAGQVAYETFYVNADSVNVSDILANGTTAVQVNAGTLVVNQDASGVNITVTEFGAISGDYANAAQVGIASEALAQYTQDVEVSGVKFTPADVTDPVLIYNAGEQTKVYGTDDSNMSVSAKKLEMTKQDGDVTVSNAVYVDEIVNTTTHALTLDNVEDTLELVNMNITNSTVKVYTDLVQDTEATVSISGVLQGGDATLLANLTLVGGAKLDVDGGDDKALTLGSTLTFDLEQGGLVNLDQDTIDALAGLNEGERLDLIVAADQTKLKYGDSYEGVSYDTLFSTTGLTGPYTVYANEGSFGLLRGSQVPEPTTGTLSLLALAALAARRRRK